MCGLIALLARPGHDSGEEGIAEALARMRSRGPDGEGIWRDDGVVIGHRRLAIIDIDPRAGQPMLSGCGRYAIAYNGEIYNYGDLRDQLSERGSTFRTTSDTEVLLELFGAYGEAMLPRLRGMFAFVIWDRVAKRAFVARDPYGIKPLYYAQTDRGVFVGSQVKALLVTGAVSSRVDRRAQVGLWLTGSVPEPLTWYEEIRALGAGCCAWIDEGRIGVGHRWCDIADAWRDAPPTTARDDEVQLVVRAALERSVRAHLVSDVPVGILLSGGIDSGALAGLMSGAGATDLHGITIAFDEFAGRREDEVPPATRVAASYGIRHHVRRVAREEFIRDLPRIVSAMDQPSIDGINTWYASKAAAEAGLKVMVSGVGGDELFQGYSSFRRLPRIVSWWRPLSQVPLALEVARWAGSLQARRTGIERWRYAADWSRSLGSAWFLDRGVFSPEELRELMDDAAGDPIGSFDPESWIREAAGPLATNPRLALGQIESTTYLRNQLLRDSDWASMDHSVELRTPLVDWHLLRDLQPVLRAFSRFPNKSLLAAAPKIGLPKEVVERRKTGFGIPIGRWLEPGAVLDSRAWSRRLVAAYSAALPC